MQKILAILFQCVLTVDTVQAGELDSRVEWRRQLSREQLVVKVLAPLPFRNPSISLETRSDDWSTEGFGMGTIFIVPRLADKQHFQFELAMELAFFLDRYSELRVVSMTSVEKGLLLVAERRNK